ncbi:hypothetical protein F5Y18DRAFT_428042 [Xylariaceae sp. FL1019]|nr:hypothetical protein F5Y18DRAFT_428042 [Xylariaceae sp. FL1019]
MAEAEAYAPASCMLPYLRRTSHESIFRFAEAHVLRGCEKCKSSLSQSFNFPGYWWSGWCKNSNGYFGTDSKFNGDAVQSHTTWWKTEVKLVHERHVEQYRWQRLNLLMHTRIDSKITYLLLFDLHKELQDTIYESLRRAVTPDVIANPYWLYAPILEHLVELHETAIWGLRGLVRTVEKERDKVAQHRPNSRHLHEIARHAIHQIETLDYAIEMGKSIIASHERLISLEAGPKIEKTLSHRTEDKLVFFKETLFGLRCRAVANNERLQNEIGLTFHMIAEMDAGVSRDIGQAAKEDSSTMKTLTFIGVLFLPATFISAIFSTSFFKFGDNGEWSVSDKFWVYWATAVPITTVTILLWVLTQENAVIRILWRDFSLTTLLQRRKTTTSESVGDKSGTPV